MQTVASFSCHLLTAAVFNMVFCPYSPSASRFNVLFRDAPLHALVGTSGDLSYSCLIIALSTLGIHL